MDKKSRKRGVKASRQKLETAMLTAGIKTQAALAEKIADQEGLAVPPKDTINRAFRQENVSPTTIARIAKILNVEAYQLYLSSDEDKHLKQVVSPGNSPDTLVENEHSKVAPLAKSNQSIFIKWSVALLVVVAVFAFAFNRSEWGITDSKLHNDSSSFSKTKESLVIYSKSETTDNFVKAVYEQIQGDFNISLANRALIQNGAMSVDIAGEFQSDGVITVRSRNTGRFIQVQVFMFKANQEKLLWIGSFSNVRFQKQLSEIIKDFEPYLRNELEPSANFEETISEIASKKSQSEYLQARQLLDDYQSELNTKNSQALLRSSIESSPNFAKAHAALCETFLRDSWRENEKNELDKAQESCDKALKLKPEQPYIISTVGFLYRRTGRVKDSIVLLEKYLHENNRNVDVIATLSQSYRDAHRQELVEFPNAHIKMIQLAKEAVTIEPEFWLHHSNLGLFYYTIGNTEQVALAFEKAAFLNPNELAFTNVATINLCHGKTDKAVEFYHKAIKMAPDSYLGYEALATSYFLSGKFSQAIKFKKKALATFSNSDSGGLYQMWGDLGDAFRHSSQTDEAIEAYLKALKLIEREELRGNISQSDKVYRFYYELVLRELAPSQFNLSLRAYSNEELEHLSKIDMEASAYVKLGLALYFLKDFEFAKRVMQQATDVCLVYQQHPDYIRFTAKDKAS